MIIGENNLAKVYPLNTPTMYYNNIYSIDIPFIHDAALALSSRENNQGEKIYKFRSLYVDPNGECAISYYGHLTEQEIKEIMLNFCYPGEDKSYEDIHPIYNVDYYYLDTDEVYTVICTPDNIDYRTLNN